ncbi:MAG: GNAT family N-acetyltransferase [Alphaproteobacteria bacterium]|nr:GNAT family N-acetyltransferase [Alphaproteobacteria bacterium]
MDFAPLIQTPRLVLKRPYPVTFALAEEIYEAVDASREHIAEWLPWASTMNSAEDEFVYLKNYCEKKWDEQTGFAYMIRRLDNDEFLGMIDLVHINHKFFSTEIGYWLKQSACGFGYMTEAVLGLEKEAFRQGFHRIVIGTDVKNLKSASVAKNAGYHLDGVLRNDRFDESKNIFCDSNVWSKLKTEV